jgi:hypothetical protein
VAPTSYATVKRRLPAYAGETWRQRRVQRQGADRVGQPAVGEHRRVDAAHQVAQLGQGAGGGLLGLDHHRGADQAGRVPADGLRL